MILPHKFSHRMSLHMYVRHSLYCLMHAAFLSVLQWQLARNRWHDPSTGAQTDVLVPSSANAASAT